MRGLGQAQVEALGAEQQDVEKAARQPDVVVDHQEPVAAGRRMAGQQGVEVLELAAAGTGRRQRHLHVVAGAGELGPRGGGQLAVLGALDPQHQHAPARRMLGGRAPQAPAPPGERLARVQGQVGGRRQSRPPAHHVSAAAGEEVGPAVRGGIQGLGDAPHGVGGHDRPVGAAPADRVPGAPGQRAQLGRRRRRLAPALVVAAGGATAAIGRGGQAGQARVPPGPPMVEPRRGHVADPAPLSPVAPDPLLLVAGAGLAFLERPQPVQRAAANRQVGPPYDFAVGVVGAEVERRDRRVLPAAQAQVGALEPRTDRTAQHVVVRRARRSRQQRVQPARRRLDVVVHENHQVGAGRRHARVARGVEPLRLEQVLAAGAVAGGDLGHPPAVAAGVVDHNHLGARGARLGGDRVQGDVEVAGAVARGHHDRGAGSGSGHRR